MPRGSSKKGTKTQVVKLPLVIIGDASKFKKGTYKQNIKEQKEDYKKVSDILHEFQIYSRGIKNKIVQHYWEQYDFANNNGWLNDINHDQPEKANDSEKDKYLYHKLIEEYPDVATYIIDATRYTLKGLFSDKKYQEQIRKGEISVPSFRDNQPIDIRNQAIHIHRDINGENDPDYYLYFSILSKTGSKRYGLDTQFCFKVERVKKGSAKKFSNKAINDTKVFASQAAVLERCISGEYKHGTGKLVFDKNKGKWSLNLSYSFEVPKNDQLDPEKIMGVDVGIACAAYMGFAFSEERSHIGGGEVEHFRLMTEKRKRDLQKQSKFCGEGRIGHGYETRMIPLRKLSDSIARFRDTANDKYSRYIVDFAKKHGCGTIQMEDLSGISKNNLFLKDWTYFDLQSKIEQKAKREGIVFNKIKARYTSQRCSKCGYIDPKNRPKEEKGQAYFCCRECGYEANADYNASVNIATKDIEKIIKDYIGANPELTKKKR